MHDHRLNWLKPILVPALVALAVLVAGSIFLDRQSAILDEERTRAGVLAEVSLIRAKLEGNINGNIQLVRGLVSAISTEPDMGQERFAALVSNLFEEQSQLRSVAAAPDLVIAMTYPLEGNQRAIGLDYRTNDAQRAAVLRARDTGKLVLAGPVDLVQGGRGFVGRFPVYTDSTDGSKQFWGVVSAVVDVGRLYADSGLIDPNLDIDISITGKDATGGNGTRFFGRDLSGDNPVTAEVILPSGSWEIAAVPKTGWGSGNALPLRIVMFLAGLLILVPIVITGRMVGERQLHFRKLKAREADLARVSRRLGLALATSQVGVWEMDVVTQELVWDDRMNELYGLPADGGVRTYTHWRGALHPDDFAQAEADFAEGMRTGRYQSTFRTLHPDGTILHIRTIGAVYVDADSNPKILGVNWDVTADIARSEELERARALTEARNHELEAAKVRIEHNALHDSLTGLPNRRYLDEMLKRHAATGYGETGTIALLHIDLDRFKQINDTLGHAAGDAMLIHASAVLRANCRHDDFVARVGGDEFVVLTTASDGDIYLGTLAERIVKQMHLPVTYEGHQCRFGVSIGIAAERGPAIDVKRLLINADIALYRAKARGRNRFEFFSEALQAEVVNTKRIADEILNGLERNEFVAYYQPQFDAHTLDVVGVEALARWRHPTEGIKAPDSFMPIAEELNVVATIDRLILDQSLAALARWDAKGLNVPRVSVNVSLKRLHDEDLINRLRQLDIAPGRISFELVESIYLDESDGVVAWNIDQLKELGIDVEIDDFGTGYASIVSLQKLRPTRLKIDRQLVNPILVDMAQRQLLTSIIDIGKSMGIEVVAEGVETMEHAAILRDLGCDILQGYAFARPLSEADLEVFLGQQAWRQAS
ncbi:bifunctional diguanylate cyclase/phosphodiesterase [Devosia sp. SL43]|uniref:bifunctional diguanylate cyclase/phosphodiesterase n=1 Tax=Devosia sp. SL43 TaxID=2806348 RepID=UPI001F25AD22|nr:EAL domain-containing protein [Devosia sp. SL43]UJW87821.1 EAL domain-containing protein [Devosia sp. SL43]